MKRLFKEIAITSSAGTITLNATDMTNEYCIIGSDVTINTGLNITMAGMSKGHGVIIYWSQKVIRGANNIVVFGKTLSSPVVNDEIIFAAYNGTTWDVWELPAALDKLLVKDDNNAVTWGTNSTATETDATAFGRDTTASGAKATAFGDTTTASGDKSTAFGETTQATAENATSFGKDSVASGVGSTCFGVDNVASGDYSTAFGNQTTASGDYSTSFGNETTASGAGDTAFGYQTTASGGYATAFGNLSQATAGNSTAFGYSCAANAQESTAFGRSCVASGNVSTAFGYVNTSSGNYSTAFGYTNEAHDYIETVFGRYATISAGSQESWQDTDVLFKIGNGTGTGGRADALKMLKNGNTTVNGIWTFVDGISYTNPSLSATTVGEALDEIVELILGS